MSVLIKGIEMPVIELEWTIRHGTDGKWYAMDTNVETTDGEWHEIVPVPPHGRLIEKHDVFKLIQGFPEIDKLLSVEFMEALYNLPTIIPAEP